MNSLRLILADQLSESISSLEGLEPTDTVMLCEVMEEATYVLHHPKKIAFLFSAMRHFAHMLKEKDIQVHYVKLDDANNTGHFTGEVQRAVTMLKPSRLMVTEPGEYRVLAMMNTWQALLGIEVKVLSDNRFLATHAVFADWAKNKKQLRMEFFYREMRKKYLILMEPDGKPIGGQWNYDKENRKPPHEGITSPPRLSHKKSPIVLEVLRLVKNQFNHHFGTLEPFHYAVTREQAMAELEHFMTHLLPNFGDYQDAMWAGEPYLYHSLISSYLNAGLLLPLEICHRAEAAYREGMASLSAVEGFIRQILGWREYIRGIYWYLMPEYAERNRLNAKRPLPAFYWGEPTQMFCIAEAIRHTSAHAYSHHIQRLMITGNFALIAGLDVKEVQAWYLAVYSDAYEWVELPNTLGMALFGDGGIVASKPYAASGKYIHRMSNYCDKCQYNPNETIGENACPFNAFYWDFMVRHEVALRNNPRLSYVFSNWDRFPPEKQLAIRKQAMINFEKMTENKL